MKKKNNNGGLKFFVWFIIIAIVLSIVHDNTGNDIDNPELTPKNNYSEKVFSIIASNDNTILDESLKSFAKKKRFKLDITYADTLEMIDRLNSGEKYDAILISNSMWLRMLDSKVVKTSDLRSTSISPIIFGIKESKAEELGFIGRKVYTREILDQIKNGNLKFSMANPLTTNSGVAAYLEVLTNIAGNPEVLKSEHLKDEKLKTDLKAFFKGIERTSGDENFLETSFINGDYDAAFTYESQIININKKLEKNKKETLYAIYPVDGVAIADNPFVYIDNQNEKKKELFDSIQEFLLSNEGQKVLLSNARRTWYGGISKNAPKDIFNPKWGINTTEYITPIKYPSMTVINEALALYQMEFRKPVHVVFCLDYSGSMYGKGIEELRNAMKEILTTTDYTISFSERDKIDVIPFGSSIIDTWSTSKGLTKEQILNNIETTNLSGSTALYAAALKGVNILAEENRDEYVTSIIVMTDGMANVGTFSDFKRNYNKLGLEIPIYSITFGDADEDQLNDISNLTNGKVFDGKTDLTKAFKQVRGYN